jgi:hypothetical protein
MNRIRYADLPADARSALLGLGLLSREGVDVDLTIERLRRALRALEATRSAKPLETAPGKYETRARALHLRFETR